MSEAQQFLIYQSEDGRTKIDVLFAAYLSDPQQFQEVHLDGLCLS